MIFTYKILETIYIYIHIVVFPSLNDGMMFPSNKDILGMARIPSKRQADPSNTMRPGNDWRSILAVQTGS